MLFGDFQRPCITKYSPFFVSYTFEKRKALNFQALFMINMDVFLVDNIFELVEVVVSAVFFFFFFFSYPLAAMWLFKHFVRICLQHMWCLEICIAFHIIRLKSVSLHFLPSHSRLSHFAICCTMFRLIFHSMSLFFFQYWFCLDSFVLLLFASCAPNDNEFRVCLFFCWSSKFIASMWLVRS